MLTLHAVAARPGPSLALFATGLLTTSGCVTAVSYGRATDASSSSAAALVLLAVVALSGQALVSVRARTPELSLARLRGTHGLALIAAAVGEPALVLLAAGVVGTATGQAVARAAVHHQGVGRAPGVGTACVTAAIVLAVSVAVLVAVSWRTVNAPLFTALYSSDRARPPSSTAMFLSLLVLIGAFVSVYQARRAGTGHAGWVSFVSPALVGLAAAQLGMWVVVLLARFGLRSLRLNGRLRWFLTLRRLGRRTDGLATARVVVAAVVVAGVAGSGWAGAVTWRHQSARMKAGGPVVLTVPAGPFQAYVASHEADPDGRWLMAMSATPDESGGSFRDVFVDTPRWTRVEGSFFGGDPIAEVSSQIDALHPHGDVRSAQGRVFAVSFSAASVRRSWPGGRVREARRHPVRSSGFAPLRFTVDYVDSDGNNQTLQVPDEPLRRPVAVVPRVVGYSAPVLGCARACSVTRVWVQGLTGSDVRVFGLTFAGMDLLAARVSGLQPTRARPPLRADERAGGLDLHVRSPYAPHVLLAYKHGPVPAALVTPGLRLERSAGAPQAYGVDGRAGAVRVAGHVPALPLLGSTGLILDLRTALRGAGGRIPGNSSAVVARADTPPAVLDRLTATGVVAEKRTVDEVLAGTGRKTSDDLTLYAIIAGFGLLIAAVAVLAGTAAEGPARRREAASLRVIGVDAAEISSGYRCEAALLGAVVTVVSGLAVWLACRALLGVLPLVDPGQFGLLFDAPASIGLVASLAVGVGLSLASVVWLRLRRVARSSPPDLLRGEDR